MTEQDVKTAKLLGDMLGKAKFSVDIKEAVDLYKCLVWLSTLPKKKEDHVIELRHITVPEPEQKSKPKKAKQ